MNANSPAPRRDYEFPAGPPHRFAPWRDEYGRVHENVPRCCGWSRPRNSWSGTRECHRKGVVQRGPGDFTLWHPERWYCLQHDPARADERRIADAAPILRVLLREALDLMPQTKRAAEWRRRAARLLETLPAIGSRTEH